MHAFKFVCNKELTLFIRRVFEKRALTATTNPIASNHGKDMHAPSRTPWDDGSWTPKVKIDKAIKSVPTHSIPRNIGWDALTTDVFL